MAFKRGLVPKEAMGIGDIAIAPKIEMFYSLDPTNMMDHPDGTYGPERVGMREQRTHNTLVLIQRGETPKKLRFYAILTEEGKFIRLNKYTGRYVGYKGKKYKILEK